MPAVPCLVGAGSFAVFKGISILDGQLSRRLLVDLSTCCNIASLGSCDESAA